MKELIAKMREWQGIGKPFAVARVIQTWGSSPRPVGSVLIVSAEGEMAGSVSGGCVEGAVLKESKAVIALGVGKYLNYGVSDDEAWSVGLTCGGKVQVYLQPFPVGINKSAEAWDKLLSSLAENKGGVLVTILENGVPQNNFLSAVGVVTGDSMPDKVLAIARETFSKRKHESITIGEVSYFIQVFSRRSQLLIIGAAHIAADLVQLAHLHDFETIVIDPRSAFAENTQFVQAPDKTLVNYPSEVLNDYPLDESTYAVILSHDPKIDDDALRVLLRSKVAYVGALGSKKTHEKRVDRLTQAGFTTEEINRIESPVGVDIHASGAKEIALSIMGGIIRAKNKYN